jgi:hypothetical protein
LTITSDPDLRVVQGGNLVVPSAPCVVRELHHGRLGCGASPTLVPFFFFFQRQITESIKASGFK